MIFIVASSTRFGVQLSTVTSAWIKRSVMPNVKGAKFSCSFRWMVRVISVALPRWWQPLITIRCRRYGIRTSGRENSRWNGFTWKTYQTLSCVTSAWRTTKTSRWPIRVTLKKCQTLRVNRYSKFSIRTSTAHRFSMISFTTSASKLMATQNATAQRATIVAIVQCHRRTILAGNIIVTKAATIIAAETITVNVAILIWIC